MPSAVQHTVGPQTFEPLMKAIEIVGGGRERIRRRRQQIRRQVVDPLLVLGQQAPGFPHEPAAGVQVQNGARVVERPPDPPLIPAPRPSIRRTRSIRSGTINSAAALGVGARTSAAKSAMVKSIS